MLRGIYGRIGVLVPGVYRWDFRPLKPTDIIGAVNGHLPTDCPRCSELLTEYIAAGNQLIDTKKRLKGRAQPTAKEIASALIDDALERRSLLRKRLSLHQELHRTARDLADRRERLPLQRSLF